MPTGDDLDYASYLVDQAMGAVLDAHNQFAHAQKIEEAFRQICAANSPKLDSVAADFHQMVEGQRAALLEAKKKLDEAQEAHKRLAAQRKKDSGPRP